MRTVRKEKLEQKNLKRRQAKRSKIEKFVHKFQKSQEEKVYQVIK